MRDLDQPGLDIKECWLKWSLWALTLALCGLRFFYLNADFPNGSLWQIDQAKYTDEGWWAGGAVMHHLLGHWNVPGDYNPAVAVPVWPLLLGAVFHFTGVNIFAARALSVLLSVGTVGLVFLLVRRYSEPGSPEDGSEGAATLAALLLAASPFAFVFSRIAILDTFVVFQFCLLMLAASYVSERRVAALAILALLVPVIILTKTTAALLLPAVLWIVWTAMKAKTRSFLTATLLVGVVSAILLKAYVALAVMRGFGADYHYFFHVNLPQSIVWSRTPGAVAGMLRDGMWIDHILYPLGLLSLVMATLWLHSLWRNPLFTASWIAFGCQAIFLFSRQDDYAPRYFLVMLAPIVISVDLAVEELRKRYRSGYWLALVAIAVSLGVNVSEIVSFLHNRTFQFYDAATSIAGIVNGDTNQNRLILGVSGSEISLMTGLLSINDAYGTEELGAKVLTYRPGWYVVWNRIGAEEQEALSPFQVEKVASYAVFDDDDRGALILYRLANKAR